SSQQNTTNYNSSYGLQNSRGIWGNNNQTYDIQQDNRMNIDNSMRFTGEYAGVSTAGGNFTVTDGGAFDLVGRAFDGVIGLTRDTVGEMGYLADSVTGRMSDLAGFTVGEMGTLADRSLQYNTSLARDAVLSGNDLARDLGMTSAAVARDSIAAGGSMFRDFLLAQDEADRRNTEQITNSTRDA
ncbi:hypothetical protein, partial [Burkholderia vietnamiensis]|uniref:hypothetical protein n=1 Tax=Burkholderia vietnamiensis TaxID=60552 RepID=UPI00352C5B2E